ncbi:isoleucine--tRNA ligase [Candidatus Woesearchaeota archaeon]|nr:isoleucine--tRNA ligase [Candidatus Woesearchaeota archaeon]
MLERSYDFKKIEEKAQKLWEEKGVIQKALSYDDSKPLFSFLEGPPTANAPPALHHVEVRVFKDLFCRYKFMQGFTVPRKGGWDCHGLPVEVQVEKKLGFLTKKDVLAHGVGKFNRLCREDVFTHINDWEKLTEKMAFWIDLKSPYVTLDTNYTESVWWSLKQLYEKKLLYEDHKVLPYCPRCGTSLSSHEVALGYNDITEETITVAFRMKESERYLLAWTTTPWTLPGNVALAVHPDIVYSVVEHEGKQYILAKDAIPRYFKEPVVIEEFNGSDIVGKEYVPLFSYYEGKVDKKAWIVTDAKFVTTEEGTGIVHQAPAFGEEDYDNCREKGLAFVQPINEDGIFTDEAPDFKGLYAKDADPKIIDYLEKEGSLFRKEPYTHTYPFCWRCDTALLYYAMKSWFIKVSEYKEQLLENNQKISWYPSHIKDGRFGNWLESAKNWALSRSKFWGTPLPIWRCECGEEKVIGSIKELKEEAVSVPPNLDLHKPVIDAVKLKCKCGKEMTRVPEVIDCWYDSGAATFAQFHYPFENEARFKKGFPYDFIAEAIDQTRGWFYTLHVLGTLLFGENAYKSAVCAGHVVDEKGEKMSKSKGNVLDPWDAFEKVGVDAVRLHMCSTDPGNAKRFGFETLNETTTPFFVVLWNSCRFVSEFLEGQKKDGKNLAKEDQWLISRTNALISDVTKYLENHDYHICLQKIKNFVNDDLSRWYIKIVRERAADQDPALAYSLGYAAETISKLIAPFAPYLSEEIYQTVVKGEKESVHLESWPKGGKVDAGIEERMDVIKEITQSILAAREELNRGVRWPLGEGIIVTKEEKAKAAIRTFSDIVKSQTNTKKLILTGKFGRNPEDYIRCTFSLGEIYISKALTEELEAEGYSREIIRRVQYLRKVAGLKKSDRVDVVLKAEKAFKERLSSFYSHIKERIGAEYFGVSEDRPEKGFLTSSKARIKDKEFEIFLNKK